MLLLLLCLWLFLVVSERVRDSVDSMGRDDQQLMPSANGRKKDLEWAQRIHEVESLRGTYLNCTIWCDGSCHDDPACGTSGRASPCHVWRVSGRDVCPEEPGRSHGAIHWLPEHRTRQGRTGRARREAVDEGVAASYSLSLSLYLSLTCSHCLLCVSLSLSLFHSPSLSLLVCSFVAIWNCVIDLLHNLRSPLFILRYTIYRLRSTLYGVRCTVLCLVCPTSNWHAQMPAFNWLYTIWASGS